jgi:glycosyltransferase involved in cell wall biosynthesis
VLCLHDFFVGNMFLWWAQEHMEQAKAILRTWYGDTMAEEYFRLASKEDLITATHEKAPMTEWLAAHAVGTITHSSWGVRRVLQACPGPVRVVPLAYEPPAGWPPGTKEEQGFVVLTVGNVNSNKRPESILLAIAASARLKSLATIRFVGAIHATMRERLESLAAEKGVRLVLSGEVTDGELAMALRDADVVCCLRWPTLEAASASTVEAMLCGKPTVVMDTGFYAELPGNCVVKVRPQHELQDLRNALETLAEDTEARRGMGERAAHWAKETFSARNYARQIAEMAVACRQAAPVLDAVERATLQLKAWGDMQRFALLPETLEPLELFDDVIPKGRLA